MQNAIVQSMCMCGLVTQEYDDKSKGVKSTLEPDLAAYSTLDADQKIITLAHAISRPSDAAG